MADDVERLRGMSDEVLQKVSNAFDFGETLNAASMRQIVEILADELEAVISQPACNGDFEGDVWFGHPEKRTLGTHIWRAGAWHELPSELDAVLSLLSQARSQRDANADIIATLRADVKQRDSWIALQRTAMDNQDAAMELLRADLAKAVEVLHGYKAAVSYISADSWDGCSDCINILKAARCADMTEPLTLDETAAHLKRIRKHYEPSLTKELRP